MPDEFSTKLKSPDFRKKNRNYRFDEATIQQPTSFVQQAFRLVTPTNPLPTLCRDPDDNHVLQLAEFVQADYLITGNKDLLVLDPFGAFRILSPKVFAETMGLVG
ncbi:putative toxin-antitoxin system toxin component, PIN family [Spirosoma spitsbergense]|uniref:putative toxin-antitoxin system toxin component, PIN family n=1 Tax=Spirosoma spitsbergense TaxID=431554 RepID=UPI000A07626A|nr:putative toxin-antitoxin system toxin component, PIN family [Spirosoma spitsbergense]